MSTATSMADTTGVPTPSKLKPNSVPYCKGHVSVAPVPAKSAMVILLVEAKFLRATASLLIAKKCVGAVGAAIPVLVAALACLEVISVNAVSCAVWRSSLLSLGLLAAVTKVFIEVAKSATLVASVALKKLLFVLI